MLAQAVLEGREVEESEGEVLGAALAVAALLGVRNTEGLVENVMLEEDEMLSLRLRLGVTDGEPERLPT